MDGTRRERRGPNRLFLARARYPPDIQDSRYNLANLCRRLVLPMRVANWSLTSLQQRLVKTGRRLIKHARYYWMLLAESHLTRRLFAGMLRKIAALPPPAG